MTASWAVKVSNSVLSRLPGVTSHTLTRWSTEPVASLVPAQLLVTTVTRSACPGSNASNLDIPVEPASYCPQAHFKLKQAIIAAWCSWGRGGVRPKSERGGDGDGETDLSAIADN
jgi:hypothetical protein